MDSFSFGHFISNVSYIKITSFNMYVAMDLSPFLLQLYLAGAAIILYSWKCGSYIMALYSWTKSKKENHCKSKIVLRVALESEVCFSETQKQKSEKRVQQAQAWTLVFHLCRCAILPVGQSNQVSLPLVVLSHQVVFKISLEITRSYTVQFVPQLYCWICPEMSCYLMGPVLLFYATGPEQVRNIVSSSRL